MEALAALELLNCKLGFPIYPLFAVVLDNSECIGRRLLLQNFKIIKKEMIQRNTKLLNQSLEICTKPCN